MLSIMRRFCDFWLQNYYLKLTPEVSRIKKIAVVLGYDTVEFTPIKEVGDLCKHVFVLIHKQLTF